MLSFLSGFSPQALAAKAFVIVALCVGAYFYGHHTGYTVAQSENRAAIIQAQIKAESDYKAAEAKQNAYAADLEKQLADARASVQIREKVVTRIVKQPVYKNACFDKDGLNELNDFIKHKGGRQ